MFYFDLMALLTSSAILSLKMNPISKALALVSVSLSVSMVLYTKLGFSWMSYMLILTYLSGVIILFMYLASISLLPPKDMKIYPLILPILVMMFTFKTSLPFPNSENFSKLSMSQLFTLSGHQSFIFLFALLLIILLVMTLLLKKPSILRFHTSVNH